MALSKVDLANQVENDLPQSLIANNVNFRNIIINGDMSIAQRGTSTTSISSGSNYYTVDRNKVFVNSGGTWTMTQETDAPSGQGFVKSLKMDCTTANASLSAGSYVFISQRFEGQNLQYLKKGTSSAESLTASFWVKSNKTGTYILEIKDSDNTRTINKSYTISSADTWEKKTITFDGDTTGTLDNDNNQSIQFNFYLAAGTDYTSGTLQTSWGAQVTANRAVGQVNLADSTSNEWYITGVQLEAGTSASDFEFLPVDVNLRRCERYYQKSFNYSTLPADNTNSEFIYQYIEPYSGGNMAGLRTHYNTVMRAKPTVTLYTTAQGSGQGTGKISFYNGSSWGTASASLQAASSHKFHHLEGSSFSSMKLAQYNFEATAEL